MIPRLLEERVTNALASLNKIVLIFGPRQVGKTTLLKTIKINSERQSQNVLYLNADIEEDRNLVDTTSLTKLTLLLKDRALLLLDEAQRLDNPGLTLKIIYDNFPHLRIVATGSSSFQLKNSLSDALTGRYISFIMYPLSFKEIAQYNNFSSENLMAQEQAHSILPTSLLWGTYPEIYLQQNPSAKQALLSGIVESYLFRDILMFRHIRHSQSIVDLARALAYQIGAEVNENELANRLKIDRKTVTSYIDILEQSYVIFKLHPFSRNPRREIGRNYKIYFFDLGIRNSLISDFNKLQLRNDTGALWENFVIIERAKLAHNQDISTKYFFWRTYNGAEIDLIEQPVNKSLQAFECSFSPKKLSKGAHIFAKEYKTDVKLITNENFSTFLN